MPTLNWVGKDEVLNHNPAYYTLEKKYTFNSKNDTSENMIIKGDNLLALKALLPQYENKIKCIYIDPPYNTGNENWVYNDNVNSPKIKKWLGEVVAKDDLSRHDKWLCMMLPRLKLLHRLLSDDGVIFISIDDNEMANLKLLCDEVFGGGQKNHICNFIWEKKTGSSDAKHIATITEYILCYAKNVENAKLLKNTNSYDTNRYKLSDEFENERGKYYIDNLDRGTLGYHESLDYPIECPDGSIIYPNGRDKKFNDGWRWKWSRQKTEWGLKNNFIEFRKNKNGKWSVCYKIYMLVNNENNPIERAAPHKNLIQGILNTHATTEIKKIFEDIKDKFSTPKPLALLTRILEIATDKNSIILDSFAGSGTTAHAVLELNKKDGGNRKFILIEMEDYAENITAERVKRVIKGYGKEPENSATGGDFSFYELGDRLLEENGNLNENISIEKIREYIYFSETKEKCEQKGSDFLGECNGVTYYFIYKKDDITTLDFEYLAKLKKASSYVIYADVCVLSDETMMKYNITFKKIPRDIKKV